MTKTEEGLQGTEISGRNCAHYLYLLRAKKNKLLINKNRYFPETLKEN